MDELTRVLQAGLADPGFESAVSGLPAQGALMQLAASAAFDLLRARDTEAEIAIVLERCGRQLEVDRLYVFEALPAAPGELVCSMHYEWVGEGINPEIDNPDMRCFPMHVHMPWQSGQLLAERDVAGHVREFIDSERRVLEAQDVQSLLLAPVMLDGRFWGFIGADAVRCEREWQAQEAQLLRLLGSMIGACIERRRSEARLSLHARVFESTRDGVLITDPQGCIVAVNAAFSEITGYGEAEVLGRQPKLLSSGQHEPEFFVELWQALEAQGHWHGEIWNRRKSGDIYPQRLTINAVYDSHGRVSHYVGVGTDISALKQSLSKLEHMAHHDALTELPNRVQAKAQLQLALQSARARDCRAAVVFMDLDGFKHINDSLGHAAGDVVLVEIGQRLRASTRTGDTLARLGGDEFVVVVEGLRKAEDAGLVADKLLKALATPILVDGRPVFVSASAGISVFPDDGEDAEVLIRNADSAMYQAKAAGHSQRCFYAPHMNADALALLEMDAWLKLGLQDARFELHYQPKLHLSNNLVTAVEALLRLRSPEGELISPGRFIPQAERSGLIVEIGAWVLAEACAQLKRWRDAGFNSLRVAVNVSPRQFRSDQLLPQIEAALAGSGLPGEALELEVTESVLMEQPEQAVLRLEALRRLGLSIALDDFGTGYSSLAYLIRLPIQTLKIDRSFISSLEDSGPSADIVSSVIALAQRLRLQVVAEGVETAVQLHRLRTYGCDQVQGFLLSVPQPAEALGEWMRARVDHHA